MLTPAPPSPFAGVPAVPLRPYTPHLHSLLLAVKGGESVDLVCWGRGWGRGEGRCAGAWGGRGGTWGRCAGPGGRLRMLPAQLSLSCPIWPVRMPPPISFPTYLLFVQACARVCAGTQAALAGYNVHVSVLGWAGWGEGDQLLRERQCQPLHGRPACTTGPPIALTPACLTMQRASWTRRAAWSDAGYPITNLVLKHVPSTGHLAALARILPSQASVLPPPTSAGEGEMRWPTITATCPVQECRTKCEVRVGACRVPGVSPLPTTCPTWPRGDARVQDKM